jgi:hypothetical protein
MLIRLNGIDLCVVMVPPQKISVLLYHTDRAAL